MTAAAELVAVTFHNRPFLVIHADRQAQGAHVGVESDAAIRRRKRRGDQERRSARTACAEISGSVQGVVEKGVEKLLRGGLHAAVVTVRAEVCLRCGEHLYSKAQGAHDDQSFQGGGSSPQAGGSRVIGMAGQDPLYSADVRAYFARLHPM